MLKPFLNYIKKLQLYSLDPLLKSCKPFEAICALEHSWTLQCRYNTNYNAEQLSNITQF